MRSDWAGQNPLGRINMQLRPCQPGMQMPNFLTSIVDGIGMWSYFVSLACMHMCKAPMMDTPIICLIKLDSRPQMLRTPTGHRYFKGTLQCAALFAILPATLSTCCTKASHQGGQRSSDQGYSDNEFGPIWPHLRVSHKKEEAELKEQAPRKCLGCMGSCASTLRKSRNGQAEACRR